MIDPSTAHQIFGRAGRPQFDRQGYVFVLPHEDDVKILRWKEKYDQIPEDTQDPGLMKAKKALKKKMPTRSPNRQYWNEAQFQKLRAAPPGNLVSQGQLPWRLLAYMLQLSPDVDRVRHLVRKRLMDPKRLDHAEKHLHQMLRTLHAAGVVRLEPEPPPPVTEEAAAGRRCPRSTPCPAAGETFGVRPSDDRSPAGAAQGDRRRAGSRGPRGGGTGGSGISARAGLSHRTDGRFFHLPQRQPGVCPVSARTIRAGRPDRTPAGFRKRARTSRRRCFAPCASRTPNSFPPGPWPAIISTPSWSQRGLITAGDLYPPWDPDIPFEERKYAPALGEKLRMLFDATYPGVHGVFVQPVWAAGELLNFECKFQNYIGSRDLAKQEGLIFRHLLRLVLLLGEFSQVTPPGMDAAIWRGELKELADRFTACCREVDPASTEYMLAHAADQDVIVREPPAGATSVVAPIPAPAASGAAATPTEEEVAESALLAEDFGAGIVESE